MKIIAMSDIHGYLPPDIPECDVVCICGDILPLSIQRDTITSVSWLVSDFKTWAENLPCKKVIFIAGKHDIIFEYLNNPPGTKSSTIANRIFQAKHLVDSKLVYLMDSEYVFEGVKFYGIPWVPDFYDWAFYASNAELVDIFNKIPADTDVLMTYCPPRHGEMATILQESSQRHGVEYGSKELADVLNHHNIKYNICGHIHSGSHEPYVINNTTCVNVCIKDENFKPVHKPFMFEL